MTLYKTSNHQISILMPVYNEEDVIEANVLEWINEVVLHLPTGSELVIDNASTDGTTEILEILKKKYSFLRVIRSQRDGFFNATIRLYEHAKCDVIFFTDSDGQYVPSEFWKISHLIDEYDLINGVKEYRKDPLYRVQISVIFNLMVRLLFNIKTRDINSAFKLVKKIVLDSTLKEIRYLKKLPNTELYIRAIKYDFKVIDVMVEHRKRLNGVSRTLPAHIFILECFRACFQLIDLRLSNFRNRK